MRGQLEVTSARLPLATVLNEHLTDEDVVWLNGQMRLTGRVQRFVFANNLYAGPSPLWTVVEI